MKFFQELTITDFLALVFSFLFTKMVSFVVCNSTADVNTVVSSVNEGPVAKAAMDRELRVGSLKGDDVGSVGDVIVEQKSMDEKSEKKVDQFGNNGLSEDSKVKNSEEQCFHLREMRDANAQGKGSEKVEMLIEKEGDDDNMKRDVSKKEKILGSGGMEDVIVEEQKTEIELEGDDRITDEKEGNGVLDSGENEGLVKGDVVEEGKKRDESDDDEDDDWEGIERSELEKVFALAVNYVEYGWKGKDKEDHHLTKLNNDVQMQLYGLHKVAVEGPCCERQPIALKVSAHAKWNAWQRLGSMSQEASMEQYVRVLSDNIPGWMHDRSTDDDTQRMLERVGKISTAKHERKLELNAIPIGDSSTG